MFKLVHNNPVETFTTEAELISRMADLGHPVSGKHQHRGLAGSAIPEGVPKFEGVAGPMRDGAFVRYESREVYRRLSV